MPPFFKLVYLRLGFNTSVFYFSIFILSVSISSLFMKNIHLKFSSYKVFLISSILHLIASCSKIYSSSFYILIYIFNCYLITKYTRVNTMSPTKEVAYIMRLVKVISSTSISLFLSPMVGLCTTSPKYTLVPPN